MLTILENNRKAEARFVLGVDLDGVAATRKLSRCLAAPLMAADDPGPRGREDQPKMYGCRVVYRFPEPFSHRLSPRSF